MRLTPLIIFTTILVVLLNPVLAVTPTPTVTHTPTPTPMPLPTLHVAAAASLKNVMQEIAKTYPAHFLFSFEASSILEKQIESGAPADLFISADEAKMDALQKAGLVLESSRHDLLTNNLVVVEADGTETSQPFKSLPDLTLTDAKIAIGQPDTVPAGIYAKAALVKAGVWDKAHAQLVPCENVRAALAAVESGDARYAIIYQSDTNVMKRAHIVYVVPSDLTPKIIYPVACVRAADSSAQETAVAFEKYLLSPGAATVFQKYGFVPIKPGASPKVAKELDYNRN